MLRHKIRTINAYINLGGFIGLLSICDEMKRTGAMIRLHDCSVQVMFRRITAAYIIDQSAYYKHSFVVSVGFEPTTHPRKTVALPTELQDQYDPFRQMFPLANSELHNIIYFVYFEIYY